MSTEILRPNADGDVIQLYNTEGPPPTQVDNWSYVDEEVADDIVTYVYTFSEPASYYDLYNLPAHSVGSDNVNKITVKARIYNTGNDTYARICIKTGGTVYYSGNLTTAQNTWEDKSFEWALNPKTGLAWTWNDIDALQIGIENIIVDDYIFCTQLYVEIDYTEITATTKKKNSFKISLR